MNDEILILGGILVALFLPLRRSNKRSAFHQQVSDQTACMAEAFRSSGLEAAIRLVR